MWAAHWLSWPGFDPRPPDWWGGVLTTAPLFIYVLTTMLCSCSPHYLLVLGEYDQKGDMDQSNIYIYFLFQPISKAMS